MIISYSQETRTAQEETLQRYLQISFTPLSSTNYYVWICDFICSLSLFGKMQDARGCNQPLCSKTCRILIVTGTFFYFSLSKWSKALYFLHQYWDRKNLFIRFTRVKEIASIMSNSFSNANSCYSSFGLCKIQILLGEICVLLMGVLFP